MIRLIGILTGSAIAVGILIVTLGMPDFSTTIPETAEPTEDSETLVKAMAKPSPADAEQSKTDPETQEEVQAETPAPIQDVSNTIETLPPNALVSAINSEAIPPAEPAPPMELPPIQPTIVSDANWYAFWSPFRSELAADGFVAQLQRTTGLDYRVVKLKPGVYEVAFAYLDENDIQDKLARISTATGLDLSGG
ncbi:MAG: hypothetical protein ACR2QZ_12760 [Woeseiaceae bacterium]